MNSYDEAKVLQEIIGKVADSSVKNGRMPTLRIGTVVSYDHLTNLATLYLAGDEVSNTSTFLNKSGQPLSVNDQVYILVLDGSLSNAFIAWKKGLYDVPASAIANTTTNTTTLQNTVNAILGVLRNKNIILP